MWQQFLIDHKIFDQVIVILEVQKRIIILFNLDSFVA